MERVTVPDGKVNTMVAVIKGVLQTAWADGAAVMTGINTTMKNIFTYLGSY